MINQELIDVEMNWPVAFEASPDSRVLAFRVKQMTPSSSEIFTGKLLYTRSLFGSMQTGTVTPLRRSPSLTFNDALSILSILATFTNIARTGDLPLSEPGFWVSLPYGEDHVLSGRRLLPVMPVCHLMTLSGRSEAELNDLLRPLLRDGAIRALRNQEGVEGILLNEGFVSINRIQGFLRP